MVFQVKIAIAGAGVSGFATLGYLAENLRALPSAEVLIYWLQPPREIQTDNLSTAQRDGKASAQENRLAQLKKYRHRSKPAIGWWAGLSPGSALAVYL
ncbi:MAG: hypothetical protein HC800_15545 [Phormidesmis sp. RL_2_1]|nr:hypothetical protein [Phormidesmis sp. RL_2_1]